MERVVNVENLGVLLNQAKTSLIKMMGSMNSSDGKYLMLFGKKMKGPFFLQIIISRDPAVNKRYEDFHVISFGCVLVAVK